jgi:hypothetical protein
VNAVEAALYSKLTGDGTLVGLLAAGTASVHAYRAPENSVSPLVVFSEQADTPGYTFRARAWENLLYLVKGVVEEYSMKTAGQIAERLDALLSDGTLSISGRSLLYLRRETGVRYSEQSDGKTYYHAGGVFRVWTT